jgi:hypothetical protein
MGGRGVRREPTLLKLTEQARDILHQLGWMEYFNRLQGYDTNVMLEFFQNLQGENSMVWGIQISVTPEILAEVTGLPNMGIQWTGRYTTLKEAVETFTDPGEELDKKGKGLNPSTLREPWKELAGVIQWYITCDGRYDVIRPRHLKLLAALKQRLVLNLPFFLNAILHEVALRTQKSKDPVTIISHHRLVKLITIKALSQTQLTWDNLIEANRPPQLEQPELCHEEPPQEIEDRQAEETTTQREIPSPQTEAEVDPAQITETQTSQTQALTKKRKRATTTPTTIIQARRRSRRIQETTEAIQDTTKQPEELQNSTEQSPHENAQGIRQEEQTSQRNDQEDTQPTLSHLTEQFMKSYEVEIAQVLGSLGTSLDRGTNNPEIHPEQPSSSKPVEDFPDIEMSFPEDRAQEEPHFETRSPLGQTEQLEGTEEQPSADQNEEGLETSHKQKSAKIHKKIRKLKKENKLLKKKAKKAEVLKQKVVKLKEIIKELRKQLEQTDKSHRRKKNKRARVQGRNPLPKEAVSTNSVGIQTDPEEIVVEETVAQNEEAPPLETQENMIATEAIDAEVQTAQLLEKNATIRRLEEELMQSQQTLIQNRSELLTMAEHQALQSRKQSIIVDRLEAELTQVQQALTQSREEMSAMEEYQASQSQAQSVTIDRLKEELTQAQQALAQHQHGMVTRTEYQRIVKELKDMTTTEGETYAALTRAQEKIKKVQTQLEKALEQIKEICDVYSDAINCRAPATNYMLFLLERYFY